MRFKGRTALVSGAGGPMGAAIASRLAAEGADLVPLAVTTMKFKILELRRNKDRGHQPLGDSPLPGHHPNPETVAAAAQRESRILNAILQLGPRCRLLFLLKLQGFNFIEIMPRMAAASINTVYTWDRRCRAELQKLLGGAH